MFVERWQPRFSATPRGSLRSPQRAGKAGGAADGEIDLLARNTTYTLTRDTSAGLNFAIINYYDGQGFLVPKGLNVAHAAELSGATVCVQTGTTTELNLADYFRTNQMKLRPVTPRRRR